MLLKVLEQETHTGRNSSSGSNGGGNGSGSLRLKNMHVADFPEMTLFLTDLVLPDEHHQPGKIIVTYVPPVAQGGQENDGSKILEVPLQPSVEGLTELTITMHQSPTKAYDMGARFNDWFSDCFGYRVVLAYLGTDNSRRVLDSFLPNKTSQPQRQQQPQHGLSGLLSSVTSTISSTLGYGHAASDADSETITFADCAPYLIVTEASLDDVSARLPDGEKMDITKFRPSIVLSGAETAWEEDFWAELVVSDGKTGTNDTDTNTNANANTRFLLTANCGRCQSINIDYATGKPGTGESGSVLKKLMKDRRVDKGAKYSPIFGRYAFLDNGSDGACIRIGDEVVVSKVNSERMVYGECPQFLQSSRRRHFFSYCDADRNALQ